MIPGGSNSLISSNGCLTYHLPPHPCYCALIISSLYLFRQIKFIQSKIYVSKFLPFSIFPSFSDLSCLVYDPWTKTWMRKEMNSDEGWGNVLRFIITSIHTRLDSPLRRALKTQKSQEPNNSWIKGNSNLQSLSRQNQKFSK